jgi:signal peptidase
MITSVSIAGAVTVMRIGFVPVLTNSMAPSLGSGSVAITRQKATGDLSRGDAVILPLPNSDGQRYLHRIIEIRKVKGQIQVTTKGDNNPLADPWTLEVTSSKVPVAVASIPYLGWTTNVLRGTIIRLVFASLIIVLIVVALVRIRRQLLH